MRQGKHCSELNHRCYHRYSCPGAAMTVFTSALSSLKADPAALLDTGLITAVSVLTLVGLLYGLRELGREIRQFRRVKA